MTVEIKKIALDVVQCKGFFFFAVYFSFPNPQGQAWALLGHITNTKPSAIFKITNIKKSKFNYCRFLILCEYLINQFYWVFLSNGKNIKS